MVGGVEEGGGEKLRNSNDVERVFVSVGFDLLMSTNFELIIKNITLFKEKTTIATKLED